MTLKNYIILPILAIAISGCSLLGTKQVEIVSKPIEIDIMQPDLPRPVQLTAPEWYVVSEAVIANPCAKIVNEEGKLMGLPLNPEATMLWRMTFDNDNYITGRKDFVVGPAIYIKKHALKNWA